MTISQVQSGCISVKIAVLFSDRLSLMRLCSSRFFAIFLAVFVLFEMHGASLHVLSHALQDVAESSHTQSEQGAPSGHEGCETCLSFAAAGASLLGEHVVSISIFLHQERRPLHLTPTLRRTAKAYLSRAPPQRFV